MSPSPWSAAVPFDPEARTSSPALEALFARPAATVPAVLLVAGAEARRGGWAARAAVALAAAWADRGGRVVLADLLLDAPELHEQLGEPNAEGLVDVFEFGASVARVSRTLPGRGFRFIPAGAYVPEPEAVLRHARWGRLIDEFAEDQATLIAYVPDDAPGIDVLAKRIGKVIALAGPGDEDRLAVSVTAPAELILGRASEGIAAGRPLEEDRADDAGGWAGGRQAPFEPPPVDPWSVDPVSDEQALTEPVFVQRHRRERRRIPPAVWIVVAVVVLVVGWIATRSTGGEPSPPPAADGAAPATEPGASAPAGEPAGSSLPFSVAIEAHQDFATAQERVASLRESEPDLTFYLAPIPYDTLVYYRVLAGPVADSMAATELMRHLVEIGQKTAVDPWAIRPTVWAFQIAELESREAARSRAAELDGKGVPTYIVEIPYTEGPSRYRVYAGAYESRAQAEIMAQLLETAGVDARLVRRTGKPAA